MLYIYKLSELPLSSFTHKKQEKSLAMHLNVLLFSFIDGLLESESAHLP